jgi:hypothetical protein
MTLLRRAEQTGIRPVEGADAADTTKLVGFDDKAAA